MYKSKRMYFKTCTNNIKHKKKKISKKVDFKQFDMYEEKQCVVLLW